MKVVLRQDVPKLGEAGTVQDVKPGFARNYLIPQGFAISWSKGAEKQVDSIKASRAAKELATLEEAQALKAKLEAAPVKLPVKAGREGRLFGSVKTADVADAVKAAGLGDIDKRSIEITTPVKSLGRHDATVRLRSDVLAALTLDVVSAK